MKFSIIDTKKKLERLILHLESIPGAGMMNAGTSIDKYLTDQDLYIFDTVLMLKSPDFAEYLVRLFRLTSGSKMERKIRKALVVLGEHTQNDLLVMLDGDHGFRAAMVLAEIGGDTAFRAITQRAGMVPDYIAAAIRVCSKNADDAAIEYLVGFLQENKPLGFPQKPRDTYEPRVESA